MKKIFLGATFLLGITLGTKAQTTIYTQAFSTAAIPTGWSQTTPAVAADKWKFTNKWGTNMSGYFPMQGYCACVDDWDNNPSYKSNWDSLKGPSMNCSAATHVFVSLNYFFYMDDGSETGTIAVSTNGGLSWTQAVSLPNTDYTATGWSNGVVFDISTLAAGQSNVMIAFTYYNGAPTSSNFACGMCVQDVDVYSPANYDVKVTSQNTPYFIQIGTAYNFTGTDTNYGGDAITSMDMNYSVNGGSIVTQSISSISGFAPLTGYNWSMNSTSSAFTPATAGIYNVKYWANNLNGSNANINIDTLTATFWAIDSVVSKQVLFEEFGQASCDPCLYALPNLDAVMRQVTNTGNTGICNIIRNHVDWPGVDYMNDETQTPFVNARVGYYGVNSVPDAKLDGSTDVYPGSITVAQIQQEHQMGSPFKINISSATYDAATNIYSASVKIKSFAAFPAGLTAQAVLTVDTIDYVADQSDEDPQSYFAPPIGSGTGNDDPDSMYDYVLHFPNVAEDMMPSSSGSALTSFAPEGTQTLTLSWTKNRPWGSSPLTNIYDSVHPGTHLTVFVQTTAGISAESVPATYVFQSAAVPFTTVSSAGINEIANGVSFQVFPNPTNSNATVAFKLDNEQNVTVEIDNMLGEKVYTDNEGSMTAGAHTILLNGSNLQNGVYFVRFITNNGSTTKKLIIQH